MSAAKAFSPVLGVKIAPSPLHGKGIFTTVNIPGGKIFLAIRKTGHSGDPDRDWERTIIGRYANHANTPNTDAKRIEDGVFFVSKRPLKKGTELTVSYGAVEMAMSDIVSGLADLGAPPPIRRRLLRIALDMVRRTLARDGINAYIPNEGKGFHMDLHVDTKNKAEAAIVSAKLVRLFGMEVKKRHDNGTHLLFLPHLIAVVVNPKKR